MSALATLIIVLAVSVRLDFLIIGAVDISLLNSAVVPSIRTDFPLSH